MDREERTVKAFEGTSQWGDNAIRTSKYTLLTFPLWNLLEQLRQRANLYFVAMLILQCCKRISPTGGVPTMALPLSIVMGATAIKDFWEDYKKRRADEQENSRQVLVLRADGREENKQWRHLRPGDVVVLRDGTLVPADVLVLESKDGQGLGHSAFAYVETKDLDGEADLKQKQTALPEGLPPFQQDLRGCVSASIPEPGADLYKFRGKLRGRGEPINLSMDNLILRGSTVAQTERVVGLVIYCGHETRVMLNAKPARFKQSELGAEMNRLIIYIFILQVGLCIVGGFLSMVFDVLDKDPWYLLMPDYTDQSIALLQQAVVSFFVEFGKWVLLLNNMVPISLIVTLNTVTLLQGRFIESDPKLAEPENGILRSAEVHVSQVIESLGQVTHIVSDKTGTLTRNTMTYKACSVGGRVYSGNGGRSRDFDQLVPSCPSRSPTLRRESSKDLRQWPEDIAKSTNETCKLRIYTLLCHAVCHTVTVKPGATADDQKYQASSMDEIALVSAAHKFGLELVKSGRRSGVELRVTNENIKPTFRNKDVNIHVGESDEVFIPIEVTCHFDGYRKRMSVVAKLGEKLVLFVKGADSSMLPLLLKDSTEGSQIRDDVHAFATSGLRTLIMAYKELKPPWFEGWNKKYQEGSTAEREGLVKELESQLTLLCATGIEDELQDKVNETIDHMRDAGIVLWVLTGDKAETAVNIAYACNLFTQNMHLVEIREKDGDLLLTNDKEQVGKEYFWKVLPELAQEAANSVDEDERRFGLTITGDALNAIVSSYIGGEQNKSNLFKLMHNCQSVLCCRVSPSEKAQVVQMVKRFYQAETGEKPVTLAVGDGANDVAMINEAHVGVGVAGKEGAQAARTADYAISQFHFLERLLFVHGREAYRRNSILICYSFYKNMILVLPMFFFGYQTSFSGAPFYEQILFQFYNVAFTALPIMAFALFDRALPDLDHLQKDPKMYFPSRQRRFFNGSVLLLWMTAALVQAAVLSLSAYFLLGDGSPGPGGFVTGDLWTSGAVVFLWVIVGANMTLVARMNTFLFISVVALAGSVLCHPLMLWVTETAGMGVPVSLKGAVGFMYGSGAPRCFLVSFLALALFCLLGEPFLRSADGLGEGGSTESQESTTSSDSSSCCHYELLASNC